MTENKKILVIDDNPMDRGLISKLVQNKLKAQVVEAESGLEALKLLGMHQFDLVILDVNMPHMTGDELVFKIREIKSAFELPIIMASGNTDDTSVAICLQSGANDFITKPINFETATSRIINQFRLAKLYQNSSQGNMDLNNPKILELKTHVRIALNNFKMYEHNKSDFEAFGNLRSALLSLTEIMKKVK